MGTRPVQKVVQMCRGIANCALENADVSDNFCQISINFYSTLRNTLKIEKLSSSVSQILYKA